MRKFTRVELGAVPLGGPTSRYLNAYETSILIALVESVRPRVMIEFGCNEGITAKRLLESLSTLEKYIGIDVAFGNKPALACQSSETPANPGWAAAADPRFFYLEAPSQMLRTGIWKPATPSSSTAITASWPCCTRVAWRGDYFAGRESSSGTIMEIVPSR